MTTGAAPTGSLPTAALVPATAQATPSRFAQLLRDSQAARVFLIEIRPRRPDDD